MDRVEFLERIDRIKIWRVGDSRAPHKPLLLLLALGRVLGDKERLGSYGGDIENRMRELLHRFGPPRRIQHPDPPYFRLPADGLWEIPGYELVPKGAEEKPLLAPLRETVGGFPAALYGLLKSDPALAVEAAHELLHGHFPESMHADILDAVGIPEYWHSQLDRERQAVQEGHVKRGRDPKFRHRVLRAYERRCAVCEYDVRVADQLLGLEAAHIRWHSEGGPDTVPNGVAMCAFHHKAFDRGALGLECSGESVRVLISSEVSGRGAGPQLLDFRGRPLRVPRNHREGPNRTFVDWHRREVFREPALDPV